MLVISISVLSLLVVCILLGLVLACLVLTQRRRDRPQRVVVPLWRASVYPDAEETSYRPSRNSMYMGQL